MSLNDVRLTTWVHDHVQGVGFRWYTRATTLELGLVGYAQNYSDGRVLVAAEGPRADCESLLAWLEGPSTSDDVTAVVPLWQEPEGALSTFDRRWACASCLPLLMSV